MKKFLGICIKSRCVKILVSSGYSENLLFVTFVILVVFVAIVVVVIDAFENM